MKGSYILLVCLERPMDIMIGGLGEIAFKEGRYAYVGSAMGGLEQRVSRHLRSRKAIRWHIDYLLRFGRVESVHIKESTTKCECYLATELSKRFDVVPRFGSSDCNCKGHLLIVDDLKEYEDFIKENDLSKYYPM